MNGCSQQLTPEETDPAVRTDGLTCLLDEVQRSEIPSIQSVITGLIHVINDPQSTARDLRGTIEIDPPLTARVLKMANSAYYAPRVPILDIMQAIIFVGFDAIKELALSQKVVDLFRRQDGDDGPLVIWKHSVAVALMAKLVYRREYCQGGEIAYAAGLLHDIGLIILSEFAPEQWRKAQRACEAGELPLATAERRELGFDHAELGMAITAQWEFPHELCTAIGHHHRPHRSPAEDPRLDWTLFVVDRFVRKAGLGLDRGAPGETQRYQEGLRRLQLGREALDLIYTDVGAEIRRMEDRGLLSP